MTSTTLHGCVRTFSPHASVKLSNTMDEVHFVALSQSTALEVNNDNHPMGTLAL